MADFKDFTVPFLGQDIAVREVPIEESTERFSDYTLADGTKIRAKTVVTAVLQLVGQYDNDGNPLYVLKNSMVVTPIDVPVNNRRPK